MNPKYDRFQTFAWYNQEKVTLTFEIRPQYTFDIPKRWQKFKCRPGRLVQLPIDIKYYRVYDDDKTEGTYKALWLFGHDLEYMKQKNPSWFDFIP